MAFLHMREAVFGNFGKFRIFISCQDAGFMKFLFNHDELEGPAV